MHQKHQIWCFHLQRFQSSHNCIVIYFNVTYCDCNMIHCNIFLFYLYCNVFVLYCIAVVYTMQIHFHCNTFQEYTLRFITGHSFFFLGIFSADLGFYRYEAPFPNTVISFLRNTNTSNVRLCRLNILTR